MRGKNESPDTFVFLHVNTVFIQDSLNNLNVYKASPEEIVQRKLSHRSNNLELVKQDKLRKRIAKGTPYFLASYIFTARIRRMGEGNVFTRFCVSVHTPGGQATSAAGGMPLAVSQEDFLVFKCKCTCANTYLFILCMPIGAHMQIFIKCFCYFISSQE